MGIEAQSAAVAAAMEFSPGDVAVMLDMSDGAVQDLMNRRRIPFQARRNGQQTRRFFSYGQVKRIAITGALMRSGFEPHVAAEMAAVIESCAGQPQRFIRIVKDGDLLTEQRTASPETPTAELFTRGAAVVLVVDMKAINSTVAPIRQAAMERVRLANSGIGEQVG